MKTTISTQRISAALAMVALSILVVPAAKAECGAATRNGAMFAPRPQNLPDAAAMEQEALPEQADSPQAQDQDRNGSDVTIVGFWKKLEYSGGVVSDIGFQQFNAGGTELVNDTGPSGGGNNFCMGAWKRIEARTYAGVHPFFLYDTSGKAVSIAIEKSRLVVAADGKTLSGTWTQDNYDFSGNVLPGTHSGGTLTGTRITPGLKFPFPFPFPQ